jgi:hypothetical protein
MKSLVGKTVVKVLANPELTALAFELNDGTTMYFQAYGECCSESWFNHFSGLRALLGATVMNYEQIDMKDVAPSGRQECDQVYGQKLTTTQGIVDIELRNSSNGYYGGYVRDVTDAYAGKPRYTGSLKELVGDF